MKAIVNKSTGEVLYCSLEAVNLNDNEAMIDFTTLDFIKPFYDFKLNTFYEMGTQDEIIILVPAEVQLWKIRAVLKRTEREVEIEAAIQQLEEPIKSDAISIWNYGTSIERNSQTVDLIQAVLQMTTEQVDDIFIQADNIQL